MEIVKNSAKDCYPAVQKTTLVIMERLQQVLQMEVRIRAFLAVLVGSVLYFYRSIFKASLFGVYIFSQKDTKKMLQLKVCVACQFTHTCVTLYT